METLPVFISVRIHLTRRVMVFYFLLLFWLEAQEGAPACFGPDREVPCKYCKSDMVLIFFNGALVPEYIFT